MTHSESQPQAPAPPPGCARLPSWPALVLGLIPFIAICFTVSLWDRIYPRVLGLPFNLFWLILWILLTPLCMAGAYWCEARASAETPLGPRAARKVGRP
jgi:Protein of unknown function (DUF3311)